MALTNSVTFNICRDNAKAASALVKALVAAGYKAELLEVPVEGHAHAKAMGQASPPAAVAHDAPADVVVPLMQDIEDDHTDVLDEDAARLRERLAGGQGGSPTGPVGGTPPDRT